MPKQLNVNLAFTADTSKASKDIQNLQKQLSELFKSGSNGSSGNFMTKELKEASAAALDLKTKLEAATNVNTGKLDLTQLDASLRASNKDLAYYEEQLRQLGPEGQRAFANLANAIQTAEVPLKRASGLLTEFKTTLMNTARWQLSSSLLHGFIGGIQSAVGYAKDLNESLNNIRIVTGQSVEQMAAFASEANKAAKQLSASTLDYTNASLIYYQQGLSDRQVKERTETTVKLANVTRQSAQEVSNQMTAIWNNFDNGTKSLEYYADAITALGAKTASSSAEIAEGLSKFAAVADTIGLSYETATAALATVVAETRQSADTVGTAFKTLFSRIQSISLGETLEDGVGLSKYTAAIEKVGVQVLDINGELREADDILEDLGQRWSEISKTQQTALAQTVAGQRQYSQFMALMENWDKVRQNVGIAENAEGTLEQQQKIYADSWEAASQRVRTALESIYEKLLDDKFFIGFLNGIEKVISGVDKFIDRIGGLKGVLAALAPIILNVFSDNVAKTIDNIGYGLKSLTGVNQANALARKQEANQVLHDSTGADAELAEARAMNVVYKEQSKLNDEILAKSKNLTSEQMLQAQKIADENKALGEQIIQMGRIADLSKQSVQEKAQMIKNTVNDKAIEQQIDDFVQLNTVIGKCEASMSSLNQVMSSQETVSISVDQFQGQIDRLQTDLEELETYQNSNAFQDPALDAYILKLRELIKALEEVKAKSTSGDVVVIDPKATGESAKAMTDAKNAANELNNAQKNLDSNMKNLTPNIQGQAKNFQNLGKDSRQAGRDMEQTDAATQSFGEHVQVAGEKVGQLGQTSLTTGQKLMKISMALTAIGSFSTAIQNVFDSITDVKTDGITKVETAMSSLSSSIPGVLMGISSLVALGMSAGPAVAVFAGLTAVMTAAKIAFAAFKEEAQEAWNQSAQGRLERMQSATDAEREKLEKLKQEAENIKTSFDTYDSVIETLEKCKTGTQEWKDALTDVNASVADLVREYPELLSMRDEEGNSVIYTDENGALRVSDYGREELTRRNNNQQIQSQAALFYTQQRGRQAEIEAETQKALEDFYQNDNDLLKTATNNLVKSLANSFISSAEDNGSMTFKAVSTDIQSLDKEVGAPALEHSVTKETTLNDELAKVFNYNLFDESVDEEIRDQINEFLSQYIAAFLDPSSIDEDGKKELDEEFRNYLKEKLWISGNDEAFSDISFFDKLFEGIDIKELRSNLDLSNSKVNELITANQTATASENDILAKAIIGNNASLLRSNDYTALMENAGSVFSSLYEESFDEFTKTIQEFKEGSLEEAGKLFENYVNSDDELKNKVNTVEYDTDDGMYHFFDKEGKELGKATAEQIAAYQVATENTEKFAAVMIDVATRVGQLKEGNNQSQLAANVALSGGRGVGTMSTMSQLLTPDITTGETYSKHLFGQALGYTNKEIDAVDFEKFINTEEVNRKAEEIGAQSGELLYQSILDGFKEGRNKSTEIVDSFKELFGNSFTDGIQQSILQLTTGEGQGLIDSINKINLGPAGKEAGKSFVEGFSNIIESADVKDRKTILETFSEIDWTKGEQSLQNASDALAEQGIYLKANTEGWSKLEEGVKAAEVSTTSYQDVVNKFHDAASLLGSAKAGDIVKEEDYQKLLALFPQLDKYFLKIDEDSRKVVQDIESFDLSKIEAAMATLQDEQDAYQKVREQTSTLLSGEQLFGEDTDYSDFFDEDTPLGAIAKQLGYDRDRLLDIIDESSGEIRAEFEDDFGALKDLVIDWYNTGLEGGYEQSFLKEMFANLIKDEQQLADYKDFLGEELFNKQQSYLNATKIQSGETLTAQGVLNTVWGAVDKSGLSEEDTNALWDLISNIQSGELAQFDLSSMEGISGVFQLIVDKAGESGIEINYVADAWLNLMSTLQNSVEIPTLDSLKGNLTELASFLGGGVNIGDTVSASGLETLEKLMPGVTDSFIKINDNTYQLAQNNELLNGGIDSLITKIDAYSNTANKLEQTLTEHGLNEGIDGLLNSVRELENQDDNAIKNILLDPLQTLLGSLDDDQLKLFAETFDKLPEDLQDISNFSGAELEELALQIKSFIASAGGEGIDTSQLYNVFAATLDSKQAQKELDIAIEEGNTELEEALRLRLRILKATEDEASIQDKISQKINNSKDENLFDSEAMGQLTGARIENNRAYKNKDITRDQYKQNATEIGQSTAERLKSGTTTENLGKNLDKVQNNFKLEDGTISNIKAYVRSSLELVQAVEGLNNVSAQQAINQIFGPLTDYQRLQVFEEFKDEFEELFNIKTSGSTTSEQVANLIALTQNLGFSARDAKQQVVDLLQQSNTSQSMIEGLQTAANLGVFTDEAGQFDFNAISDSIEPLLSSMQQLGDYTEAEEDAFSSLLISLAGPEVANFASEIAQVAVTMDGLQAVMVNLQNAGVDSGSVEFFNAYNQGLINIASQYKELNPLIQEYTNALNAANEERINALNLELDLSIRSRELSEIYGIDSSVIQQLAQSYLDLAEAGDESLAYLKDNAELATKVATKFLVQDDALTNLQKDYSKTCQAIDSLNKAQQGTEKEAAEATAALLKNNKQVAATTKDLSRLLGVSEDYFTSTKQGRKILAEHSDLLKDVADGVEDAYNQTERMIAEGNLGELIDTTGLDYAQEEIENFFNALDSFSPGETITGEVNDMIEDITYALIGSGLGEEAINQFWEPFNVVPDIDWATPVGEASEEAIAAAEAGGQAVSDAYAGNAGVDADVKTETDTSEDSQEYTQFYETITDNPYTTTAEVVEGPDAKTTQTLHISVPRITKSVNPVSDVATGEKETTTTVAEYKGATKGSGGNIGHKTGGGSGGGGGCFVAGTLISTNDGYKKIEDIKVGDMVLSYNEQTQENEYSQVLQTFIHDITGNIYTLYIENEKIEATGIHRFLIVENNVGNWIPASELKPNDLVLFADGTLHKIQRIDVKEKSLIVYNFEVSNNHNYYIGINKILVHNKGGCFVAGTPVMMRGYYKNIEDVQVGDIVLSYNEKLKKNQYSEVLQTMIHVVNENIYTLYIENEKLIVTGIHRFLITRNGIQGWIQAADLLVGDFVLFADGTLHQIKKIDVKVELKTVYNFEVSNNHNYYVGKNQILAHNKGGRRGGGGRSSVRTTTKRASAEHEDNKERYHKVTHQLDHLSKAYSNVQTQQDLTFGKKHQKNLDSVINLQDKLIAKQKEYNKEISDNLKIDTSAVNSQKQKQITSTYKKDKKGKIISASTNAPKSTKTKANGNASFSYNDMSINEKEKKVSNTETTRYVAADYKAATTSKTGAIVEGNVITNYNDLVASADAKFNAIADKYAKNYNENLTYNGKKGKKSNKKKVLANNALKNEYEQAKAIHDQFIENLKQLQETLDLQAEQITALIDKEIEQIQNRINAACYTVDVNIQIDDSKLERLDFLIGSLNDKARNTVAFISKSAEKMGIYSDKISQNTIGMGNIISTIANNQNIQSITDNSGKKQYFNKEGLENDKIDDSKQFLDGKKIMEQLQSSDEAEQQKAIDALVSAKALTTKQLDELTERASNQLDYVQNLQAEWLGMYDRINSALDEYSTGMDDIVAKQEHYNTLMQSYKNAVDLVGKAQFYKDDQNGTARAKGRELEKKIDEEMQAAKLQQMKTYQEELKNVETEIDILDKRRAYAEQMMNSSTGQAKEEWQTTYEKYDEMLKGLEEKRRETNENIHASFEESLQANLDAWQRSMERIAEVFNESMAGNAVTLDYLADGLQRFADTHSTLVAQYEEMHQLRQLDLEAEKSINEATNPRIKRELLEIQEEITAAQTDGADMSQYELDYLRQKLELKQAEAALDDAQKAKTQVSLTRDNEGNFGYVYTADDSDVNDAEQNYADKIYEMQKANAEYIENLQTMLVQAEQDYYTKVQEITNDTSLSDEQRQAKLESVFNDYNTLHDALTTQLEFALNAAQDVYGQYSERYAEITGDITATNLAHVEDWSDTQLAIQTGIETLEDFEANWASSSSTLKSQMIKSLQDYRKANEDTAAAYREETDANKSSLEAWAESAKTEMEQLTKDTQSATTEMTTFGKTATDALKDIATEAETTEKKYVGKIGSMITKASNLVSGLNKVKEALQSIDPDDAPDEDTGGGGSGGGGGGGSDGSGSGGQGGDRGVKHFGKRYTRGKRKGRFKKRVRAVIRSTNDKAYKRLSLKAARAILSSRKLKELDKKYKGKSRRRLEKAIKNEAKAKIKDALQKKYKEVRIHFDTGGYTGDWAGNDGRMAMLHKKEMVLNQKDTSNILSAVDMIRGISEKIDLNALAQSGALSNGLSSGINGVLGGMLEQNVHITAEFPNATDRNEITEAFNNIIGLAAQYANK